MDTAHTQTRRFATSSHVHFQEHDLRSRLSSTSLCYSVSVRDVENIHAGIQLTTTACICCAPFIKVSTVFRIVLICVAIVSASVTAPTEAY